MVIRPEPIALSAVRRQILSIASNISSNEDEIISFLIAVGEALSNAYLYGTPSHKDNFIYVGWHVMNESIAVTIKDEGLGFTVENDDVDNNAMSWFNSIREERGYGINLMNASVDEVDFDFKDGSTVTLKKKFCTQLTPTTHTASI